MPTNLTDLLTPAAAAAELGITPRLMRRYCEQGRLGQKIGGRYLISREDLDEFKQVPRKVGNPHKPKAP